MNMDSLLLEKLGSVEQIASVRPIQYMDGRRQGLSAIEVKNGPMRFTVLPGKCLDIAEISWRGENLSFLAACGLQGREAFDAAGEDAQRSIMGGLLFTCGPDNVGPPQANGYPTHGRFRSTPATNVCSEAYWDNGNYVMEIRGIMRQGVLFGENLTLHRTIRTVLGERTIGLCDTLTNEGFRSQECQMLYHCNAGYPLLDVETKIEIPTRAVRSRDPASGAGSLEWNVMGTPVWEDSEQVFYHDVSGKVCASVQNPHTGRRLSIYFDTAELPYLTQWKSTSAGNYALGIEPGTSLVEGRNAERAAGRLFQLLPQESKTFHLTFEVS